MIYIQMLLIQILLITVTDLNRYKIAVTSKKRYPIKAFIIPGKTYNKVSI